MTKLKNSNCDQTQNLKLWQKSKSQIVKKTKQLKFWHKSNYYKTHRLKLWQNSQTQYVLVKTTWHLLRPTSLCHSRRLLSSAILGLAFVTIWFFQFGHNLSFWGLSQFEFLSFVTIKFFDFCLNFTFWFYTFWVIEFWHNSSFWVLSQFELFNFLIFFF